MDSEEKELMKRQRKREESKDKKNKMREEYLKSKTEGYNRITVYEETRSVKDSSILCGIKLRVFMGYLYQLDLNQNECIIELIAKNTDRGLETKIQEILENRVKDLEEIIKILKKS